MRVLQPLPHLRPHRLLQTLLQVQVIRPHQVLDLLISPLNSNSLINFYTCYVQNQKDTSPDDQDSSECYTVRCYSLLLIVLSNVYKFT